MQHGAVPWTPAPRRSPTVPILHVRNVPAPLYAELKRLAAARRRSLSAEVLELLQRSLEEEARKSRHAEALDRLDALRRRAGRLGTDSTKWLREWRDRG